MNNLINEENVKTILNLLTDEQIISYISNDIVIILKLYFPKYLINESLNFNRK